MPNLDSRCRICLSVISPEVLHVIIIVLSFITYVGAHLGSVVPPGRRVASTLIKQPITRNNNDILNMIKFLYEI